MSDPDATSPADTLADIEPADEDAAGIGGGAAGRQSGRAGLVLVGLTILVALATAATHWPALSARALALDDGKHILHCSLVQKPSLHSARRLLGEVFTPSVGGYYMPLSMISLMLDRARAAGPDDLTPFRQTSLGLHVMCTALVVVLLYQLFGQAWVAALVGLLFGVHPVTVEAIPWMAERKALLTTFFAFGCLVFYVRYTRRGGRKWYAAALFLYLLAVMAKPTTTPLAALLLLLDYWPLNRLNRRAVVEKVPFLVVAGVFVIITVISQHNTIGITDPTKGPALRAPLVLAHNTVFYLVKVVWPGELTPHYPYPRPFGLANPAVLAGVIGSVVLIVGLLISWRRTRALLVGWLFFMVAIFPALGVVTFMEAIAADRFLYFPAVGLLITLCWFLTRVWTAGGGGRSSPARRMVVVVVVLLLAVSEVRATRRYLVYWRDTLSLAERMVELAPGDSVVYGHLGLALAGTGRTDEAITAYTEAIRIKPRDAISHYNLGALLDERGQSAQAAQHYDEAIRIDPQNYAAHTALGKSFLFQRRTDQAIRHFRLAVAANPLYAEAHNSLAAALLSEGAVDEAVEHCRAALQLEPEHSKAHGNLGRALAIQGDPTAAMTAFRHAVRISPNDPGAHHDLGKALEDQGNTYEGIKEYKEAVRLSRDHLPSHLALASVLRRQRRLDEAAAHLAEAARINPDSARLHNMLGVARLRQDRLPAAAGHFRAALRCDPSFAAAHNNLGRVLAKQERWDQAVQAYRDAVGADPFLMAARINLGKALQACGRLDDGLDVLQKALEVDPQSAKAHLSLGSMLLERGDHDGAADHFRETLRLAPDNAAALLGLDEIRVMRNEQ